MSQHTFIRSYTINDFDSLLLIQKEAFPPPFPEDLWWSKEHIKAHEETFPEGAMLADQNGEPAGSATSLIINYDGSPHTWEQIADDGYIKRSHIPTGDTLYGIDVCVRPRFRGKGVAKALYDARKQLVIDLGLKRYIAGCRIPDYHHHAKIMSVDEYVAKVSSGEIKDLVLSFMLAQGLQPIQIMPDYVDDEESLNYAVIVEWKNPTI
ncbi:GNAT family N-acetyltransferase [Salipaludibacillus daqingensis]|uniref:GNAT family N-acetyltransferase n=1 Tax=Salipaludibacillus daqingensis TaxID=3041001 RepID=UPI002473E43A|nr:GNAT family N-acetyltransferase [Salipaludibacillus daqingensis]